MDAQRWNEVRRLYHSILECAEPERLRVLDELCGEDVTLRSEVESLLEHEPESDSFLEPPSSLDWADVLAQRSAEAAPPRRLGQYTVLEELGRGGMSVVYNAEQQSPRREVALKVIQSSPLLDHRMMRFLSREAQALARLNHPGIAAIYDAGIEDGVGYFAMERIDGQPLTKFADEHALARRERVQIIADLCDAIHAAHQRGVIHRDLKPSNILVTNSSQAKILDFGLARLVGEEEEGATRLTHVGAIMGTIAYMSPEQVSGHTHDVDIRTDIYSLGVMLFEILTGRLPYDVSDHPLPEAARIICDSAPAEFARASVDRDLETITRKALEKDPGRRYQSAREFQQDLLRYLRNEPIAARPPSRVYHVRKFAQRNRTLVWSLAAVLTLLVLGVTGTSIGLFWAISARLDALRATYTSSLFAADAAIRLHQPAAAASHLATSPVPWRNWEWYALWAQLDDSLYVLRGHIGPTERVAIGPGRKHILTCSRDEIYVWDAVTADLLHTVSAHAGPVMELAMDSTGRRFLTSSGGPRRGRSRVHVWDVERGEQRSELATTPGRLLSAMWHPTDPFILGHTTDGIVGLWDADTGELFASLPAEHRDMACAQFSHDGEFIVTGTRRGLLQKWETETSRLVQEALVPGARFVDIRVTRDGQWLVGMTIENQLMAWHDALDAPIVLHQESPPERIRFEVHPSKPIVAVSTTAGDLVLFRLDDAAQRMQLEGHDDGIVNLMFSPDGSRLATSSWDGTARLWDVETGHLAATLRGHQDLLGDSLAFSDDGRLLATVSSDRTARIWSAATDGRVISTQPRNPVELVLFSPESDLVALALARSNVVLIHEVNRGGPAIELKGHERRVIDVAFDHSGSMVVTASTDHTARVWNLEEGGSPRASLHHDESLSAATFMKIDGATHVVTVALDATLRIWDIDSESVTSTSSLGDERVVRAAFSPSGRSLAVVRSNGVLEIRDLPGLEVRQTIEGFSTRTGRLAWHPDESHLLTFAEDRMVRLWEMESGREVLQFRAHESGMTSASFSPDGDRILSSSIDGTARLWDAKHAIELLVLRGHASGVNSAVFSPDGVHVATASRDGTVRLWSNRSFRERFADQIHAQETTSVLIERVIRERRSGRVWRAIADEVRLDQSPDDEAKATVLEFIAVQAQLERMQDLKEAGE